YREARAAAGDGDVAATGGGDAAEATGSGEADQGPGDEAEQAPGGEAGGAPADGGSPPAGGQAEDGAPSTDADTGSRTAAGRDDACGRPEAAMTAAAARAAVVVGAGVAGLAAACGLARAGWRLTLLERSDRLRADPTGLLLWPAGVRALAVLGLGDGLAAISTPVPDAGVRRPDGRWLARPGTRRVEPLPTHAEDLHGALVAGLGDLVDVRTNVTARPVRGERPAVTDGRRTWEADLLVAADGADSALRPGVAAGGAAVSAGATAWRAVIPWFRAPADPAVPVVVQGGGYRFQA